MKIKCLFLSALLLTITVIGFAQTKKPTTETTAIAPEQVVKNLFAARKSEKTDPFYQTKNRALVDKYFAKDLAGMIWKTALVDNGELSTIDFDPLYGSQDPQITNLVFGTPKEESGPDDLFLIVSFKDNGKAGKTVFSLRPQANKTWKIHDISYNTGDDLASILQYWRNEETKKGHDAKTFAGEYTVGAMKCYVSPTLSRFEFYRVNCEGQEGFKLYAVDGNEKETAYIHTDDKGKETGKFVFKNDEKDGKYFDAAGKEVKVQRIEPISDAKTSAVTMPEESENETVSGELEIGKTRSVILYVGMETGDYAAYCFKNDSDAGRAILAKCKNKEKCEVSATLGGEEKCTVPGLEATLSADFNILKVASVKSLGRRK